MELTKKEKTIKYLCFALLIVAGALLQNVDGLWFSIGSARCFFLIPVTILLGVDEDERVAGVIGFCAGLLWDSISAQHMGFNCVFLMLICYLASSLISYLLVSTYWVKFALCFVGEVLYMMLYWLLFVVARGGDGAGASFGTYYLPCLLYTAIMTFAIVKLFEIIIRRLNKEQAVE